MSRYNVKRRIKLEMSNVYKGENRIEHHPLFAVAFLFEKE